MPSRFEEPHAAAVKVFTVQWHKNCNDNPINTFTHARLAAFGISLSLAQKKKRSPNTIWPLLLSLLHAIKEPLAARSTSFCFSCFSIQGPWIRNTRSDSTSYTSDSRHLFFCCLDAQQRVITLKPSAPDIHFECTTCNFSLNVRAFPLGVGTLVTSFLIHLANSIYEVITNLLFHRGISDQLRH